MRAERSMLVQVLGRNAKEIIKGGVQVSEVATLEDLKKAIQSKNHLRNCAYYWLFGAFIAYFVNHPLYAPVSETQVYVGFAISVVSQLSNFYCHLILKNLRSPDGKGGYQIPTGFLFNFVTCANSTTEIWQWIGFNVATQTVADYLFLAAAGYIMTVWALQKHKRLRKTFDGQDGREKYPRRWVIFPPFL